MYTEESQCSSPCSWTVQKIRRAVQDEWVGIRLDKVVEIQAHLLRELEIKTFGLGSTIEDVFSEIRSNIA